MMRFIFIIFLIFISACGKPNENVLHGYIEGEFVYIAPTTPGILKELVVKRGDQVKTGQKLFSMEETILNSAILVAKAEKSQSYANLKNLTKGKRLEEISVILKQKDQANVKLENSKSEYERSKNLIISGVITNSEFDARKSEFESAQAKVEELSALLKVANLGAREDELLVAQSAIELADQKLIQTQKQLQDSNPIAPINGQIENTYYRPGEYVSSGKPVVCILPPENIKIRFFVSQRQLPKMQIGKIVSITTDGSDMVFKAKISYIASQVEYSPPIIYSTESRQKLVFMIEATPEQPDPILRPGLPVDIREIAQ